jgi:hypothetical protein
MNMKAPQLEKMDFAKIYKDLYSATAKIKEVMAGKAAFLSVKGVGAPGGEEFQKCIGMLYGLVYTAKFGLKFAGKMDFGISKLECLWPEDPAKLPREKWPWQLLIRIPDELTAADLKPFRKELLDKKGLDTSAVERWTWKEGRCIQVMHVGPYDEVGSTFCQLGDFAESQGLEVTCPGHEIYISDPRRVPAAKLKTIIRMPVVPKK